MEEIGGRAIGETHDKGGEDEKLGTLRVDADISCNVV